MTRYRQTMTEALQQVQLSEKEIHKLKNGVKVLGNALPNRAMAQKAADKANKEMGHDADVYQSPFNNRFYVRIKEDVKESEDHEISMARGELEAIADKALKLSSMLQGKSDADNLEAWVQSKITKAKDYVNSVADYMQYNPDMANEQLEEGYEKVVLNALKKKGLSGRFSNGNLYVDKGDEKAAKDAIDDESSILKAPKIIGEQLDESFNDAQMKALKKAYEPLRGKKISVDNANKLGAMFTKFDKDKNALEKLYGADIPFVSVMAMTRLMTKHNYKADQLNKIKKETLEFETDALSEVFLSEMKSTVIIADKKKQDNLVHLCKQIGIKTKVEGDKVHLSGMAKRVLDVTMAMQKNGYKVEDTIKEMAKDDAYAIGMSATKKKYNDEPPLDKKTITKGHEIAKSILKKEEKEHPAKMKYEQIAGLKKKAEKSGMPYSILKKVYDRGMAAWRGGHRPGASQQQWAFARVNSFITKSSGTWGGADKDLAAKVKGSK